MPTVEQLTTELSWLRALARSLVKDTTAADDLVQDAWLVASDKLPADQPLRPWLSRVMLNLVRMRARGARRRAGYEAAAPVHDARVQADQLVERVEMQRQLVDAVLALEEMHRTVVLLHYFEGLTSVEIGRRLSIPDVTVRRRLQIALARLRAQLNAHHDGYGWLPAMASLAGGPTPPHRTTRVLGASMLALGALAIAVWLGLPTSRSAIKNKPIATVHRTSHVERAPRAAVPQTALAHEPPCAWRLFGAVTDANGGALAAVLHIDGLAEIATDTTGSYGLCRPPGSSLVTVSADGYGRVSAEIGVAGAVHRDFALVPEGVIRGQVLAPDGKPEGGARVVVSAAENPPAGPRFGHEVPPHVVQSADTGGFEVGGLSPGRYRVAAALGRWRSRPLEAFVEAGGVRTLAIQLVARTSVVGRVVQRGVPLEGVVVTASSKLDPSGTTSVLTDADGTFVLDSPPDDLAWAVRGYELRAPPALPHALVVLDVVPAASLHGRVTRHGVPVAGATIECDRPDWTASFDWVIQHATTDEQGQYVIDNAAPGACWLEVASAALGATSEPLRVVVLAGADTRADVELTRTSQIDGVIVDEGGAPVGFAHVQLASDADTGEAMTDEAGAFVIRGLREGATYQPSVGMSPSESHRFPGVLAEVRAPSSVRLQIQHNTGVLRGHVIDEHGVAVPDVRIRLEYGASRYDALPRDAMVIRSVPAVSVPNFGVLGIEASTVTDSAGRFAITHVVPGRYGLRADGADGASATRYEVTTERETTLVLPHAGTLEGTLLAFGATPAVVVTDHGYSVRRFLAEGGQFRVDGLSPGVYAVLAQDRSGAAAMQVQVQSGKRVAVTLTSRGTSSLEGRLTSIDGEGIGGARCTAATAAAGFASWWTAELTTETDRVGTFRLDAVPVGPVHVECWGAAQLRVQRAAVISAGANHVSLIAVARPARPANPGFAMLSEQLPPTVAELDLHGAAARAGLQLGDQIIAVDGQPVEPFGVGGVEALLSAVPSGAMTRLEIQRGARRAPIELVMP